MRPHSGRIAGFVLLIFIFACGSQEAPPAKLWTDGAWALYKIDQIDTDGHQTKGTLKISAVGKEMIDQTPYYWIEFRRDSDDGVTITKILATEKADYDPKEGFKFWKDIKRIIIQENADTPEEIPAHQLKRYEPTFIESPKAHRFGNIKNISEPVISQLPDLQADIKGRKLSCKGLKIKKHYRSSVNLGFLNLEDTTESSMEFYTNPEVPFGGIVKATYSSTTTSVNKMKKDAPEKPPHHFESSVTLEDFGSSGAKSQVIGTPVEKKVMPLPFLQKGAGNK